MNLLKSLLGARTSRDLDSILESLGDNPKVTLGERFGDGFCYKPLGDNEMNMSVSGIGTDPARALVERVTNGQDAMIELAMKQTGTEGNAWNTPYDAAADLFGRPSSGDPGSLDKWMGKCHVNYSVAVVLHDDEARDAPVVDIIDEGVGVRAADFTSTLLSIHEGGKSRKPWQIGTFGQGATASLSFCHATLVISRCFDAAGRYGVTVIRRVSNGRSKVPCMGFLTCRGKVMEIEGSSIMVSPYGRGLVVPARAVTRGWRHGTLVRHYAYELGARYMASQNPAPGCLWHALHALLVDPVIAFRLTDLRSVKSEAKPFEQRVGGARTRLGKRGIERFSSSVGRSARRCRCVYARRFKVSCAPGGEPLVPVDAYVIRMENQRNKAGRFALRTNSQQFYVERKKPVVFSYNGQNQGTLDASVLAGQFKVLQDHMVVIADLTGLDGGLVMDVFSTTREHTRRSRPALEIEKNIISELGADPDLRRLDEEFHEELYRGKISETSKEMKKLGRKLLRAVGLIAGGRGQGQGAGRAGGGGRRRRGNSGGGIGRPSPLRTLVFPRVTHMEMDPGEPFGLHIGTARRVSIETDADAEFDKRGLVKLRVRGPADVVVETPLSGGRKSWRIRPTEGAKVGDSLRVVATLRLLTNYCLEVEQVGTILAPLSGAGGKAGGGGPDVEMVRVDPDEEPSTFGQVFGRHGMTADTASFNVLVREDKTQVFYNASFEPLRKALRSAPAKRRFEIEDAYRLSLWLAGAAEHAGTRGRGRNYDEEQERAAAEANSSAAVAMVGAAVARASALV